MSLQINDGVWPTMVTPFTENKEIDFQALELMIEWYIDQGVDGLFAVCQSSEMFKLTLVERVQLAKFVKERAAGRIQVIASGHISDSFEDQLEEIKQISAVGLDAFVLVSNRLAAAGESEEVWKRHATAILEQVPEVAFGIYECPHPYKRLISPDLLRWCADTGRFLFLKDTCCDLGQIHAKMEAIRGTPLKLFNANAATLLGSLQYGAAGYSGVMANFHANAYVRLIEQFASNAEEAARLQNLVGFASLAERQMYPVNAKYHLQLEGIPVQLAGRTSDATGFTSAMRLEVEQMRAVMKQAVQGPVRTNK